MEARSAPDLPEGPQWWFEPKWDGFRCLVLRQGDRVALQSKAGKDLGRYFPEVVSMFGALPDRQFVLDGELLGARAGTFSFEALQQRLHPAASRINLLSRESPAAFVAFDLLQAPSGVDLRGQPLRKRRPALETFLGNAAKPARLSLSPGTNELNRARAWLEDGAVEGVIAKRLDEPYREGERAMIKIKRRRTADCVVGGFRYAKGGGLVGSLLLGLYDDDGLLDHVGFCSGLGAVDKRALTAQLESLIEAPGFTGDAPGGPSRWANERSADWKPLRPLIVVEVAFDHVSGGRFRHGTRLIRLRPDKSPSQCRMEQIQ